MIKIVDAKKCCGCSACAEACSFNAIVMKPDEEGFLYPKVDSQKCTNCNLCNKVCPIENDNNFNAQGQAYALQLLDEDKLLKSQSGGAFDVLADIILGKGGVVYGAGFNTDLVVVHKRATNFEQAQEFHGSKYVQSNINGTYGLIKQDLQEGKEVLFSGTACQVAGLYKFLGKNYDNLITCDLICHGVPSPLLYKKYLEYIERKFKSKVSNYTFRYYKVNEGISWDSPKVDKIVFENGKSINNNEYMKSFGSDCYLRPYCYCCDFAKIERVADFTIGDLWGVYKTLPDFDYKNGLSVIIFNSQKALDFLGVFEEKCKLLTVNIDEVKKYQPNLSRPSKANKRRRLFFKKLKKSGFKSAYNTINFYNFLYKIKQKLLNRGN